MNLVGKILVMLILVMSVVFMGFAVAVYSTHTNWSDVVNRPRSEAKEGVPAGLRYQLEDALARKDKLEIELARLQETLISEKKASDDRLAKLETQKEELRVKKVELETTLADLNKRYAEQQNLTNAAVAQLKIRDEEVAQLRENIKTAQDERDDHFRAVVSKTDELNKATIELNTAKEINDRLTKTLAQAKLAAERAGINLLAPPKELKLDGIVTASNPASGMIEVSLGSDAGLARGQTLEVHRGGRYLGRAEVLTLWPDKAVAKVLPEFLKGRIERNDLVATRFQ